MEVRTCENSAPAIGASMRSMSLLKALLAHNMMIMYRICRKGDETN